MHEICLRTLRSRGKVPLLVCAILIVVPAAAAEEVAELVPDLRIVGWTVDDSPDGNGDGGLHPGETAYLQIYLSNRGSEPARNVAGTLEEITDHPDVEILDKFAVWPDLPATGAPASSDGPHFRVRVAQTRPCAWEIPLRLELTAADGYYEQREFTLLMVDRHEVDLAEGAARPFYYGAVSGDYLGVSVTTADLDGDGYDDLIMGANGGDGPSGTRAGAGEAVIVYGSSTTAPDADLLSPPAGVATIYGADSNDYLGRSVASGDLDGDGFDDLILGAYGGDGPSNARLGAGEVVVVYGSPTRLGDIDLSAPPAGVAFLWGAAAGDDLGNSVSSGDLDGDGYDDLILGANGGDGPGDARASAGDVVLVYGDSAGPSDIDLASPAASVVFVYGADAGDELGREGVAAGDLDGDGYDDLILGAYHGDGPGNVRSDCGDFAIVYGQPAMHSDVDLDSASAGVAFVYGADIGDQFGYSASSGDLNGDGYDELILDSHWADGPANSRSAAGEVAVVYGAAARHPDIDLASAPPGVVFLYGADSGDQLGFASSSGDLDGDGYDDLVLGAPYSGGPGNTRTTSGEAMVIYGGPGELSDIDMASPPPGVHFIYGRADNASCGRGLATGDLNGDGYEDLLLGAYVADGPDGTRTSAGEVAVIPSSDRSRYRHDDDSYAFIDATTGTDAGLACDDCSTSIPIGFSLDFFGRSYDSIQISSNGYLTFEGPGDLPAGFCPPASNPANAVIAPFWDDLNPGAGGAVYYLLEGTEPNRRLTVEWHQVPLYPDTDAATFEVTLFETSNQLLFQYQDVVFGDPASDNGGTAIVGVEDVSGERGTAVSCLSASIMNSSARRLRRYAAPTVIWEDDVEAGVGGWTATGLWHRIKETTCSPSSRSGLLSWYYGDDLTCEYDTDGSANFGTLTSEVIADLPQDAELDFWHRRGVEGSGSNYDRSVIQVQADAGGFADIGQLTENSGRWLYMPDFHGSDPESGRFASLDLSSFAGQDVEIRFLFDTVDNQLNTYLGWMVDDITIRACPVYDAAGAAAASEARATARPPLYCEGASGRLDALGSYCTACTTLTYQWYEGGAPITGGTGVAYDIPTSKPPDLYDYTVAIGCPTSALCADESDVAAVTIVKAPVEVGDTLLVGKMNAGADLEFHWTDVLGADDYALFSDTDPAGGFSTEADSSPSGTSGISIPMPADSFIGYLVAGRNPTCGLGPLR